MKFAYYSISLLFCLGGFLQPTYAQQANKSGVTPNTISLPSGPGSIEGLGESFEPNLNTGQVSYGVGLALPAGTAGHTPSLGLGYNGGNGNSFFGYGWNLSLPYIQRQCDKGIPRYVDAANGIDDDLDGQIDEADELDIFINEQKEELVLTENDYYFCENEAAFVRYRRVGDHWEAQLPNGSLMEFGLTESSRVMEQSTERIYRWLVEKITDTNGNVIVFTYTTTPTANCSTEGTQKYLKQVTYGPGAPPWSHFHFVQFDYENRLDWFEDNRSGFSVRTDVRVKKINIGTQGVALAGHLAGDFNDDGITDYLNRSYQLKYNKESYWSLLNEVTWIGADGQSPYPALRFDYSNNTPEQSISAAGQVIGESNAPFQLMDNPLVDLVDLNGDALPDILKTERFGGQHTAYLNQGQQTLNNQAFIAWENPQQVGSDDGLAANVNLENTQNIAHLADMDADGLSDLVYKANFGDVYYFKNKGTTEWGQRQLMNTDGANSAPPSPFGTTPGVKTADLDFDKNIDIIQSINVGSGFQYKIWFNLGNQKYAQPITVFPENGYDLSATDVKLADFNGDRVVDIIKVRPTGIYVTAGLGYGKFSPPFMVSFPDVVLTDEQIEKSSLQDINGDGLVDLIIERPQPNQLWYWLNRGNYSLDERRLITDLPSVFSSNSSIRWTDMNGNGTTDYVYSDASAQPRLQIIDIGQLIGAIPAPNLLVMVDNGIGQKTHFDYATSTRYLLEDRAVGNDWPNPLPFPISVLSKVRTEDGMGETYESNFFYHKGYYDGQEKEFRGFEMVESQEVGDTSAPDLWMAYEFDTGVLNMALKGKQLSVEARNAAGEIFNKEAQQWQTKVLHTAANGDGRKVTFPYPDLKTQDIIEKGNGTPVRLQWNYEYDDYGNMTKSIEHGRLDEGWNDERVTKVKYTAAYPDGQAAWILNNPVEQSTHSLTDELAAQSRTYYDGFLELGTITRGNTTRTEDWVTANEYIISNRKDYDQYGNIIAVYDPLYGTAAGHYRQLEYDPYFHVFPEKEIIHTGKANPAILTHQATYDYGHGIVINSTESNGYMTIYEYDAFARLTAMTKPLDNQHTIEYDYVLAQPYSNNRTLNWIETRRLDHSEGDGYLHSRTFSDGLGRPIMTRSEGEEINQVVVTGTVQFNKRKQPRKNYLPYFETGTLDFTEPTFNTGFTEHFYDASGRPVKINQPVGLAGIAFSQIVYAPLSSFSQDEEQTNFASPHFGCGTRLVFDGLDNRIRENYQLVKLSDIGEPIDTIVEWKTINEYDLLNNIVLYTDAQNNQKIMSYDGLSRNTFSNDPHKGQHTLIYDDASNLIQVEDAKSQITRYEYDGLNRIKAEFYSTAGLEPDVNYHYDSPFGPTQQGDLWPQSTTVTAQNTLGYLTWIEDQSGEEHNSYDERGRVKWTIKRLKNIKTNNLKNFYTGFEYDAADRTTQLTYPDATVVQYQYNSRGLLEAIPNVIDNYNYNPSGQNGLLQLACGTNTQYRYDHRLRLNNLKTIRNVDQLALQDLNYSFDELSNITQIVDNRNNTTLDAIGVEVGLEASEARKFSATQSFLYDNIYRLIQASNPTTYGTIDYRYDRMGNMVQKNANLLTPNSKMNLGSMTSGGTAGSWGRTGRNVGDQPGPGAITTIQNSNYAFTYDDNGNMLTDGIVSFQWDYKNRLSTVLNGEKAATYLYDYTDNRKVRQIGDTLSIFYLDQFSEVRNNELIKYVYADGNKIAQFRTNSIDTTFFLQDHLGTTSLSLTKIAGVKEQLIKYPYGMVRNQKYLGFQADYTFTGKEKDEESDNFYFGARYYHPVIARFLNIDPLASDYAAWSPYNYVLGNPIKLIDPDGRSTIVKREGDRFKVIGGNKDDGDKGIYISGGPTGKDELIAHSATPESFFFPDKGENGTWLGTIDFTDNSGDQFLKNLIENTPFIGVYMANAYKGKKYDFKVTNGTTEKKYETDEGKYRGMILSVLGTKEGKPIVGSARDVGNIGAGYVAGAHGLSWLEARLGFDALESYQESRLTRESSSTQLAERLGYDMSWKGKMNNYIKNSINKLFGWSSEADSDQNE